MVQKPQGDAEPGEKRIDLSLPQVAGSAVAAVAAAVMASQLGVYGTIAGAGVMSVVATCGGSVFQHFFRRTGEQIREVTVQVKHPAGRQVTVRTKGAAARKPEDDATAVFRAARQDLDRAPGRTNDAERTQMLGAVGAAGPGPSGAPDPERTRILGRVGPHGAGPAGDGSALGGPPDGDPGHARPIGDDPGRTRLMGQVAGGPADVYSEARTHGTRVRGWKRPALAAVAVFAVSMGGITVYELASGTDLSGGGGTTFGSVVRGGHGGASTDPGPTGGTDPERSTGTGTGTEDREPGGAEPSAPATDPDGGRSSAPGTGDGGTSPTEPDPTPSTTGGGTAPEPTGPATSDGSAPASPDPAAPGDTPAGGDGDQEGQDDPATGR
ncbi:hypothetical protein ABZ371_13400 [Streptomyces sp. NPDC005899]|uniref:hypothetical protein n=1 Tax=Streptomyces sp. NPDC005899 TaxID=3155716 RepID=UPI0033FADF9B